MRSRGHEVGEESLQGGTAWETGRVSECAGIRGKRESQTERKAYTEAHTQRASVRERSYCAVYWQKDVS